MRDLFVILGVFVTAALSATVAALPALKWATGGQEWQGAIAMLWLIVCVVVCGYAALRALARYHHWTTSDGRK